MIHTRFRHDHISIKADDGLPGFHTSGAIIASAYHLVKAERHFGQRGALAPEPTQYSYKT